MILISGNIPEEDRERLNNLYFKATKIVYNAVGKKAYKNYHNGINYLDVAPLGNRMYGYCRRHSMCGYSTIFLNEKLLLCTDEEIMEVLIHEILHSFTNTKVHNKIWKYYANIVSKKSDYNVTRTGHIESFNHEFKYEVECLDCSFKSGFYKLSKKRRIKLDNNDFK